MLGINATSAVSVAAGDTAGKGLQSTPAILNGKTSNEDLSEDFFLSSAAEETIFVVNVNDITAAIKVPEGVYNGTQLATALQERINQMEDSTDETQSSNLCNSLLYQLQFQHHLQCLGR